MATTNIDTQALQIEVLQLRFGVESLSIKPSLDKVFNIRAVGNSPEQSFPYYEIRWRRDKQWFRALIEPHLKLIEVGAWPFTWNKYIEDKAAMNKRLMEILEESQDG